MDHFQFLPGTASLVEEVDKKLLVVLRDGRKLVGTLRSFDQFENTYERIFVENNYGERNLGLYLIRGENVVLLGEIDTQKEAEVAESKWKKVSFEEIKQAFEKEQKAKEEQAKLKKKLMQDRGILIDPFSLTDNVFFE